MNARRPTPGPIPAPTPNPAPSPAADGLPPLRDVIARHGLAAKKSLGQNFLLDLNLTGRIARRAGALAECDVLEVGPGPGGLTRALLFEGARKVVAIERDERCLAALEEIAARYPGRLETISGDALAIDPAAHLDPPWRVVANLPYNVGTELLVRWLTPEARGGGWPPGWASLTLMFQREVAERIVAQPGSKAYGRLSVLAQWRCEARIAFDVSPKAFSPPPKIWSSVVHVEPLAAPRHEAAPRTLERITAAAFGQRRKMLRQSLRTAVEDAAGLCAAAGVDETLRADATPIADFCALARALDARTG